MKYLPSHYFHMYHLVSYVYIYHCLHHSFVHLGSRERLQVTAGHARVPHPSLEKH
jgi:hypothetical protein